MARKDEILRSFLTHEILQTKYEIKKQDLPNTVRDALNSTKPIVKAIALIVEGLESSTSVTDAVLRNQVTQFLNEAL